MLSAWTSGESGPAHARPRWRRWPKVPRTAGRAGARGGLLAFAGLWVGRRRYKCSSSDHGPSGGATETLLMPAERDGTAAGDPRRFPPWFHPPYAGNRAGRYGTTQHRNGIPTSSFRPPLCAGQRTIQLLRLPWSWAGAGGGQGVGGDGAAHSAWSTNQVHLPIQIHQHRLTRSARAVLLLTNDYDYTR